MKSVSTSTVVGAAVLAHRADDRGLGRALAALVLAVRAHHGAVRRSSTSSIVELAAVGGRGRAEPHREGAAVGAVVARLGDLGAGQAGRHALDVDQRLPDALERRVAPRRSARASSATGPPARSASSCAGVSTSSPPPRSSQGTSRVVHAHQQVARAVVAASRRAGARTARARAAPGGPARRSRWRAPPRRRRRARAITRRIASGDRRGWSPSVTTTASQSDSSARPQASEADWPSSQRSQTTGSAPVQVARAPSTSSRAQPSTTTTRPTGEAVIARIECSSSGRPSSSASCLAPPKRRARARGEHEAADHAPTSWMRPPTARQPAALAAVPHRHHLGHDRERGLLRASARRGRARSARRCARAAPRRCPRPAAARAAAPARAGCPSRRRRAPRSAARSSSAASSSFGSWVSTAM